VEEAAYFKEAEGTLYVKAVGHMTALLCPSLKSRIAASLDRPGETRRIVFDLGECEYMDSTFLGLIVSSCKRLSSLKLPKPVLSGASDTCLGLLRTIGVLGLVELSAEALPELGSMERIERDQAATARFILDAHEDLSALSNENRDRFAGLTAALKKSVERDREG